jgi:hypothetical protein
MNEILSSLLPTVATALGGPLAGAAIAWFSHVTGTDSKDVNDIIDTIKGMTPEQRAAIAAKETEFKLAMAQLGYQTDKDILDANVRATEAVNTTMQAEAKSEHWSTYTWRPCIGFSVAFNLASSSIVIFIAYIFKPELVTAIPNMLTAQAGLNAVALPILGVASYFRGKMQTEQVKQGA